MKTLTKAIGVAAISALAILAYLMLWNRPPGSVDGAVDIAPMADDMSWQGFGGDKGLTRHTPLGQITPQNVRHLKVAWEYDTGETARRGPVAMAESSDEGTPILAAGHMIICTPFNRVIALNPANGEEQWVYDPQIDTSVRYANQFLCRSLSQWQDNEKQPGEPCEHALFMATNDMRIIKLDAPSGKRCEGFGDAGEVQVDPGISLVWPGEMQFTSAPAIVGDTVVVGSAISDNVRVKAPMGSVRAFDARTGTRRWTFDPAGPDTAHANVWSSIAVDDARGLVYLPTTSPATDFYGGTRVGNNMYADSVVALDGETGKVRWHFQTVHHDVWDYDLPSGPAFVTLEQDGKRVDALVQPTKTGFLFVLNRETGEPIFGVEERPVPQGGVPGEELSPTQPFPVKPPALVPQGISAESAFGFTPYDKGACRDMMEEAGPSELFQPPDEDGTLLHPFNGGGMNWGGIAIDQTRKIAIANASHAIHLVKLIPHLTLEEISKLNSAPPESFRDLKERGPMEGTPWSLERSMVLSPLGLPCNTPPWGTLNAVDLNSGEIIWQVPLGTTRDLAAGVSLPWGTPNFGGPLTTASGLVFIGAAMDGYLRAFDVQTGKELWGHYLPGGGQSGPMSYAVGGQQYIAIQAGGHGRAGTRRSDKVVAFTLNTKK